MTPLCPHLAWVYSSGKPGTAANLVPNGQLRRETCQCAFADQNRTASYSPALCSPGATASDFPVIRHGDVVAAFDLGPCIGAEMLDLDHDQHVGPVLQRAKQAPEHGGLVSFHIDLYSQAGRCRRKALGPVGRRGERWAIWSGGARESPCSHASPAAVCIDTGRAGAITAPLRPPGAPCWPGLLLAGAGLPIRHTTPRYGRARPSYRNSKRCSQSSAPAENSTASPRTPC
jgi:hypothetical protein